MDKCEVPVQHNLESLSCITGKHSLNASRQRGLGCRHSSATVTEQPRIKKEERWKAVLGETLELNFIEHR